MIGRLAGHLRRGARDACRFRGAERGATAVEFALIAPIFVATLVAIFQIAVFLFAQSALQDAAATTARYFMTGKAQSNNWTASTIQQNVCTNTTLSILLNCSNLIIVVQSFSDFAAANTTAPQLYNSNGQPITTFTYSPGTPGQVMVVQLVYKWSVVSGPLGFALANLPNSAAEIMGVSAFRVEPY